MANPYALDFSGLDASIQSNIQNKLAQDQQAMARERHGWERARQPLQLEQMQQGVDTGKLEYESNLAKRFGGFGQAILTEKDPVKRDTYMKMITSEPRMKRMFDAHLPPGWEANPDLVGHFASTLATGFQDPLGKQKAEAEVANLQGTGESGNARMARLQNELHIELAKAKSDLEVQEILKKAAALGINIGPGAAPPAAPAAQPAQQPARPFIMGTDPRFAAPPSAAPVAPPPPQQTPRPAPTRQGASPAPSDPYLQLTQPAVSPEQELAERQRRAGYSVLSGDIKGAGKILSKDEEPKEYQTKDATFSERMARSEISLLGTLGRDNQKYNPANYLRSWLPDWNLINSAQWRDYQGSAREWIAAMLRKDTGAAVTDTEWKLYFPTYFPVPGDDLDVQKKKLDRRVQAARSMRGSAGPAFDRMSPNFDAEMRARLRDIDPDTYGTKIDNGPLPPGAYDYDPATGKLRPRQ